MVAASLVSALRHRIGVPGEKGADVAAEPLFGDSYIAPKLVPSGVPQFEEEYLGILSLIYFFIRKFSFRFFLFIFSGPPEAPHNSPAYTHNFTSLQMVMLHASFTVVSLLIERCQLR